MTLARFGFIGEAKACFWGMTGVYWKTPLKVNQLVKPIPEPVKKKAPVVKKTTFVNTTKANSTSKANTTTKANKTNTTNTTKKVTPVKTTKLEIKNKKAREGFNLSDFI